MLDENLPNFYIKPNSDKVKHHEALYLTHHGSEPEPVYDLLRLDPAAPNSRNVYAAALYDSYSSDILYAEALVKPGWTQPSLSAEEVRKNGGQPVPPQPLLPPSFSLQLYNPDQQVEVLQKTSSWTSTNWYEFSMPQETFRYPSGSSLDRGKNDPTIDPTVPKINFMWKREGKLSKDMTCFLTGKSTDNKKKKNKEPDIAVAIFKGLKSITIYESNLHRVEMEDYKGLEVVLLLSAIVIRDVFFGNLKDTFHISDASRKNSAVVAALPPAPAAAPQNRPPPVNSFAQPVYARPNLTKQSRRQSVPPVQMSGALHSSRPPPMDPRTQWEHDAETVRLRNEAEAQRRGAEVRQRQRDKADQEEQRRIRKMLEAEDKENQRRQAEVDKETERLKKLYGTQGQQLRPAQPMMPHRNSAPPPPTRPHQQSNLWSIPQGHAPTQPPRPVHNSPYLVAPGGGMPAASQSAFFGGGGQIRPSTGQTLNKPKRSFLGLRMSGDGPKLSKKQSSIF